jgi:hypothetical protein
MKKFFCLFVIFALFAAVTADSTFGFGKRKKPPVPKRHETVISSVTPTAITILEDDSPKTFTITQFTEINVNEQKATVGDLKPGMRVSVTLADPTRVSRIQAWSVH